jgi:hypothetical protein
MLQVEWFVHPLPAGPAERRATRILRNLALGRDRRSRLAMMNDGYDGYMMAGCTEF